GSQQPLLGGGENRGAHARTQSLRGAFRRHAMNIKDKVAIITGSARGIGKAIAERYVKEGAKVVIADLNEEGAKKLASELGPSALGVKLDITKQESIDATIAATVAHFGRL